MPQRDPRLLLSVHLGRAFGALRQMLGGPQIGVHPQLAIHVGGDRLARQMLGGTETRLSFATHSVLTLPTDNVHVLAVLPASEADCRFGARLTQGSWRR
ncbi:hypothetical protein GCM10027088_19090 [Nocardia goodfellowii]